MLGPARLQAQPFDLVFVDNADLSPVVLVPLSVLFPHLGYGPAVESDGLNLGHVIVPVHCQDLIVSWDSAPGQSARSTLASLCARSLQKSGLIEYRRGKITVIGRKGVEECACECYAATLGRPAWKRANLFHKSAERKQTTDSGG
jgi:hypothetical protein